MASAKASSGIVVFRRTPEGVEVLLGHMGGPFWARRDDGGWTFPKGEHEPGEVALVAARREFTEELGLPVPDGALIDLGSLRQSSGKVVTLWAVEGDVDRPDLSAFAPGTFAMEWPRGSGQLQDFPEVDRVGWFPLDVAADKLVGGQRPFLDRLAAALPD